MALKVGGSTKEKGGFRQICCTNGAFEMQLFKSALAGAHIMPTSSAIAPLMHPSNNTSITVHEQGKLLPKYGLLGLEMGLDGASEIPATARCKTSFSKGELYRSHHWHHWIKHINISLVATNLCQNSKSFRCRNDLRRLHHFSSRIARCC